MNKVRPTPSRLWVLRAAVWLQLGLLCCGSDRYTYSEPRQLDRTCRNHACAATGTAVESMGMTDDSIAFEIQQGAASIELSNSYCDEILLAGEGTMEIEQQTMSSMSSTTSLTTQRVVLSMEGTWVGVSKTDPLSLRWAGSTPAWLLDIRNRSENDGCM